MGIRPIGLNRPFLRETPQSVAENPAVGGAFAAYREVGAFPGALSRTARKGA
jgi:hypothetical protein